MLVFPPDFTLVIQLVSFFVLLAILNRWLFAPFGLLLVERTAHTVGATEEAATATARADELRIELDADMAKARTSASEHADSIRREARAREAEIFEAAKQDAASRLADLRAGVEKERSDAQAALRDEATALSGQMVDAVLGAGRAG